MKECAKIEIGQPSAFRSAVRTGFFFLSPTQSLVALVSILAFSLSSQLRPAAGLFLGRSSSLQSLSPRNFISCPFDVPPNFTSSPFPSSFLPPFTTSPAASLRAGSPILNHLIHSVETKFDVTTPAAFSQPSAAFDTLTVSSAAADLESFSLPREAALSSRAASAAGTASPLRRRALAIIDAGRPTIAAAGIAIARCSSSIDRAGEASASFNLPSSALAVAAAGHSSACECFDTGACTTSSPVGAASSACVPAKSPAKKPSAAASAGLWKLRRQVCCCFLLVASHLKRCSPLRQHSQQLRCDLSSPSHCSRRAWSDPQKRQQQQRRCQALAASLSFGSESFDKRENVDQVGWKCSGSNSGSRYAAAFAATAAAASAWAASGREMRGCTALFDSQEERFSALKSLKEQETPKFQADGWTEEMPLLEVKDLHVVAVEDGQEILKGVNLTVMPGEVHAIMGRNGSGKSTLSKVLAGYPSYKVTGGSVRYKGLDLLELAIDNRGLAGLFLAFQYPIEIPMVSNLEFLRVAFNERRKWRGEEEVDSIEFRQFVEGKLQEVGLDPSFLSRPLNYGFSGGEKKRNEILQMIVLDPELVMLDETDSGLDVDSFNVTAAAIKRFAARKNKSFLVTTHYKKLLDVLLPHKIHVMHSGRVILSGDLSLASRIEKEGFASLISDDPREEEEEKRGLSRGENLLENDEVYEASSLSPSAAGGGRRDLDKLL